MPISKVPVVHKFGIISSTQRLELQERLLKQTYLSSIKSKRGPTTQRNPLEVTEEFVQLFNTAEDFEAKEKFEEKARKLLERSKRRCGVKNCGHGSHVNLPLAWTEMAQLAQCKGNVQEECLDALVVSLEVSPLEKYHIPALFFLAETMLYWLRTESVLQPFLRTSEIKLLKMGQLVFERLFYHHMAGQLQGHTESKNRLFTYIDGLQSCQEAYNPYPNALLSLRFVMEVGKIILADSQLEPGDIKEGDRLPEAPKHNLEELSLVTRDLYERKQPEDTRSVHSGAISSSVHDLSPTLWHALDVWRCTSSVSGGLRDALRALAHCGLGLASETWVDGMVAIQILGETAKTNLAATKVLHRLAQGLKTTEDLLTPPLSSRSGRSDMFSISSDGDEGKEGMSRDIMPDVYDDDDNGNDADRENNQRRSQASMYSSKASLSDIYERSEEGEAGDKPRLAGNNTNSSGHSNKSEAGLSSKHTDPGSDQSVKTTPKQGADADQETSGEATGNMNREVSFDEAALLKTSLPQHNLETRPQASGGSTLGGHRSQQDTKLSSRSLDPGRGTGWRAEVGSEFKSGRASDASSVQTFTNMPLSDVPGLTGWHWEVALTYTETLADIVLYGSSAVIQKFALVGMGTASQSRSGAEGYSTLNMVSGQLNSAGLLDLAFFIAPHEASDGGPNDWSWRIRYGAIRALVRVCRCLEGDQAREGLRTAAWNTLLRANSREKDGRVLEALKVGQVHTNISKLLDSSHQERPSSLGAQIAKGLSQIYLPPIPPPSTAVVAAKAEPKQRPRPVLRAAPPAKAVTQPVRTSLKQELELATALYEQAPDYNTRKTFDLHRIVEDQWRKELQAKLEEEDDDEVKTLKEKQKEEEKQQKEKEAAKQRKFKPKTTAPILLKEPQQPDLALHRNEPHLSSKAKNVEVTS
ncbi:transmembrane protein 232-like isoform x1 [Plakobranchus ocellatus]|uniref:Transmembrane protein 232-like isoform x1 n=1 Tax=Plakobranchus ocellatus TaxID=259542 RepID=A0AAV4AUU9_9GAST|nr:transmembrane protein 232-like isoform x1 [Plakobranchus ocellatus]